VAAGDGAAFLFTLQMQESCDIFLYYFGKLPYVFKAAC
jgi:hypothetical protein